MAPTFGVWPSQNGDAILPEPKTSKAILEEYFVGPRDMTRHSKWPRALRMHGSVTPKLILPVFCIACWATIIVAISKKIHAITVHPIVLTVLGLIVGLALNLRSITAYERYMDGRRMWSTLGSVSTSLARHIWLHIAERGGELARPDLLDKVAALNLINAFVVALKHRLRFEPYAEYDDLYELVSHLDLFALSAGEPSPRAQVKTCKKIGSMLGIPMARSNPRKELKRAMRPIGNVPLEILSYLSAYLAETCDNGRFAFGNAQNQAMNNMHDLHIILSTTDRVLNTPMPIAYSITISQITWLYILSLPFQLVNLTGWMTLPITICTSYIILAILATGNEIENPFGPDVNDLPLEMYAAQITSDVNVIASISISNIQKHYKSPKSKPLYPVSSADAKFWGSCHESDIRHALKTRASMSKGIMWEMLNSWRADIEVFRPCRAWEQGGNDGSTRNDSCWSSSTDSTGSQHVYNASVADVDKGASPSHHESV